MGGQEVYDGLVEHLASPRPDHRRRKITLEHAECLAACDYAPVVNGQLRLRHRPGTPDAAVAMVEQLRSGERPMPSRGARICTLKEMQVPARRLRRWREGAVADGPAGAPTLRAYCSRRSTASRSRTSTRTRPIAKTKPREGQPAGAGKVSTAAKKAATAVKAAAATVAGRPSPG